MSKFQAMLFVSGALCLFVLVGVSEAAPPEAAPEAAPADAPEAAPEAAPADGPEAGPAAAPSDNDKFFVEGKVYCDTCRLQFITRISEFLEGAKVKLQCNNLTTGQQTYKAETLTDKAGQYKLAIDGDYEDDDCEVVLLESPKPDCSEIPTDAFTKQAAKVSLTSNNGVVDNVRRANPICFMRKEPLPQCADVLKELGMNDTLTPKF